MREAGWHPRGCDVLAYSRNGVADKAPAGRRGLFLMNEMSGDRSASAATE